MNMVANERTWIIRTVKVTSSMSGNTAASAVLALADLLDRAAGVDAVARR